MNGARFVTWRNESDSDIPETCVEPEIAAVDDAEHDLDAFGLKHAGDQSAPGNRIHGVVLYFGFFEITQS